MKYNDEKKIRLILLTQFFDPEPNLKGLVFAKALQDRNFEIEVVTGFPNYPDGRIYDGYNIRPLKREVMDGVQVTRLPLYPSHDRSAFRRTANYVSFCISAFLYLLFGAKRADIVYVYHPPMTVGLAAAAAKLFRRTPTIIDIQDMWPDTLSATGMIKNPLIIGLVGGVCRWIYARMSHIVVLSPGFRKLLLQRGVPDAKISVILNWADEAAMGDSSAPSPFGSVSDPGRFRVLFAGNMGHAQQLDNVLEASRLVTKERSHIDFCFLGGGLDVERLKQRAIDEKLLNVVFFPKVPMREAGAYLANAHCLLVHLRPDPLFEITIPSKTQAYMAAGRPIILAVDGDAADLIKRSQGGLAVPPGDAAALADAVLQLDAVGAAKRALIGKMARDYYDKHLSLNRGVNAFAQIFRKLALRQHHGAQ